MINKGTSELLNILNSIENPSSLKNFVNDTLDKNLEITVSKFFNDICSIKGISKSTLISNAEIDRTYGYQILNGSKNPSRDNLIKLSLSAKLTLDETEKALTIGKVGKFYPKVIRDTYLIFAINNSLSIIETNILLDENGQSPLF